MGNSKNCSHFSMLGSQYVWKNNITDNIADDTMAFNMWKRYVFRPDLSNGLTGHELVTTLHPGIKNAFKYV